MSLKGMVRRALNRLGFDVVRLHSSPRRTLLGLSQFAVRSVIDVGANQGQFARMILGFYPQATLYCFEPLDDPFHKLSSWARNRNERVLCFQLALGDREGEAEMHLHVQHTASSSLLATTDTCHRLYPKTKSERLTHVRLATLDGVLGGKLEHMQDEILLKIDAQGFEDRILRGASRVLSRCRVVMLEVAIDLLYEGQAEFHGLAHFLHERGFRYSGNLNQIYSEAGSVVFLDAIFVKR